MVNIKDKDLYAIAWQEVANGVIDTGLWTKAFADSGGNEAQAKALYLKMRVIDLHSQRNAHPKQFEQQALIEQQHSIEQQKQLALNAEQQRKEASDAKLNDLSVGEQNKSSLMAFIGIILVIVFFIGYLVFTFKNHW